MKLEVISVKPEGKKIGTLVFVHGICHGAWCWKNFMVYFSRRGYDCHALSLRGHGGSEGREELNNFTMDDYVEDVVQALAPFAGNAIVIGHSMGGGVVQKLVGERPGHAKAAVLFASIPPCGMNEQVAGGMLARSPKGAADLMKLAAGEALSFEEVADCAMFGGRIPTEEMREYYTLLQADSQKALGELYTTIASNYDVDIPVRVMGSRNDLIFAEDEQHMNAEAYGTKAALLDGLCHDMMLDPEWEKSAAALEKILAELVSGI